MAKAKTWAQEPVPPETTFFHCPGSTMKHVAFVLSCPGSFEVTDERPAARTSGENLRGLISTLAAARPDIFKDKCRYEYRICNSSDKAHYDKGEGNTGDSEPDCAEIAAAKNLARLGKELKGAKYVILLGERARCVWALLPNKPAGALVVSDPSINHPGGKGLNAIKEDLDGVGIVSAKKNKELGSKEKEKLGAENTKKRLAVLAKRILDELKKQQVTENAQ